MRVLLIYPGVSFKERYHSSIGAAGGRQIPLGVLCVAAAARAHGHRVFVLDAEARGLSVSQVTAEASRIAPRVIGISAATPVFPRARLLAESLRRELPDTVLVLGGPHVSAAPEDALSCTAFDYGIMGEGEESLPDLLAALAENRDPSGIRGLVLRKGDMVRVNPARPPIPDLSALPMPAYDLLPGFSAYNPPPCNYRKKPVANLVTSRGCPGQCTFCDRSVFGNRLRMKSASGVAEEISFLQKRYKVREIAFLDDTFTLSARRMHEVFDACEERGLRFCWTCMSRVDAMDEALLRYLKSRGLWHLSLGIESGDEGILARIRKNISLENAERVVFLCRRLGIRVKGFFMLGHPGETSRSIGETMRFALSVPLDDVVVTFNTPLPGSAQFRDAQEHGELSREGWERYTMWDPVFVPAGLSREELVARHREFYRRFYLRPRIIGRYLKSFAAPSGPGRALALARALPFLAG
ncbi:MAG: radical SAM protein, partial [Thermodesulfobacteriota bacterium]